VELCICLERTSGSHVADAVFFLNHEASVNGERQLKSARYIRDAASIYREDVGNMFHRNFDNHYSGCAHNMSLFNLMAGRCSLLVFPPQSPQKFQLMDY
jgi:hypothetical protein